MHKAGPLFYNEEFHFLPTLALSSFDAEVFASSFFEQKVKDCDLLQMVDVIHTDAGLLGAGISTGTAGLN